MKYIYSIFLVVLLTSCGKDEKKVIDYENTDWAHYKLNGHVKSVSEKSYATSDGLQTGSIKHKISSEHDIDMEFNDEGMLMSTKKWVNDTVPYEIAHYKGKDFIINKIQYSNGKPSLKTDYTYDEKGKNNLSITRRNGNNTPFDKVVMKYKNDQLIERVAYNHQQNPTNRIVYYYDTKGNVTGENSYGSTDMIASKIEYSYNDKNQKVREVHLKKDGIKDYEILHAYGDDKVISTKIFNSKGEMSYEERKGYDNEGNLISHYTYDKFDNVKSLEQYTYDGNANKTGWIVYNNDKMILKANYGYDKHGNLASLMAVDYNGVVQESEVYNYQYDEKGNWIQKSLIKDNRPAIITKRTIVYFEE